MVITPILYFILFESEVQFNPTFRPPQGVLKPPAELKIPGFLQHGTVYQFGLSGRKVGNKKFHPSQNKVKFPVCWWVNVNFSKQISHLLYRAILN